MVKKIVFFGIIVLAALIIGIGGIFFYLHQQAVHHPIIDSAIPIVEKENPNLLIPTPTPSAEPQSEDNSSIKFKSCYGGEVKTAMCCKSVGDFPNTCAIGACGCSLVNSHQIKICDCGPGKCFNGNNCSVQK